VVDREVRDAKLPERRRILVHTLQSISPFISHINVLDIRKSVSHANLQMLMGDTFPGSATA